MSEANGNGSRSALPEGWAWKTLGELVTTSSGGTPSRKNPEFYDRGTIPWVKIGDLNDGLVDVTEERITDAALAGSSAKLLPAGTLLIAMYGSIGKLGFLGVNAATNQAICAIQTDNEPLRRYLYWYLRSQRPRLLAAGFGGTQANISQTFLKQLFIPVPPVEEQIRIVAAIEHTRNQIETGELAVDALEERLAEFRRSLLAAAIEGKLLPSVAHSETGAELLVRIAEERKRFPQRPKRSPAAKASDGSVPLAMELPDGWSAARWSEVGVSQNGRAFPSSDYCDEGVKLLRPGNLHASGEVRWNDANTRHLPARYAEEHPEFIVGAGELVINLTAQSLKDGFLGRVCMTGVGEECLLNQRIARLTPVLLRPEYVFAVFRSPLFRRYVGGLNKGSLIQHMFTSEIDEFILPVAPVDEQERIVEAIQTGLASVSEVEGAVGVVREKSEALWRAAMHQAFGGQLRVGARTSADIASGHAV